VDGLLAAGVVSLQVHELDLQRREAKAFQMDTASQAPRTAFKTQTRESIGVELSGGAGQHKMLGDCHVFLSDVQV
jgi:hypothetical protein